MGERHTDSTRRALTLCVALAMLGCFESHHTGGGSDAQGPGAQERGGAGDGSDEPGGPSTTDDGVDLGDDVVERDNPGYADVARSLIWIPNSDQGTITKIDTRTVEMLGTYLTSPTGSGLPSRTSVDAWGDVAVANRGAQYTALLDGAQCPTGFERPCGHIPRDADAPPTETGVTKVWSSIDECVDRNGNGILETSQGVDDILPWGSDECVAWHTPLPVWSNRAVSWVPPQGPDLPQSLWTAGASDCTDGDCTWLAYRLHGETGAIEETLSFHSEHMGLTRTGLFDHYGPYAGVADAAGTFWGLLIGNNVMFRIDGVSREMREFPLPEVPFYSMTLDEYGRLFLCGRGAVARFDPDGGALTVREFSQLGDNGCAADFNGTVWAAGGVDGGTPGLHAIDIETLDLYASHSTPPVKGVSVDIDGRVWGVGGAGSFGGGDTGDTAFRITPETGEIGIVIGLRGAYGINDMTGFGLRPADGNLFPIP